MSCTYRENSQKTSPFAFSDSHDIHHLHFPLCLHFWRAWSKILDCMVVLRKRTRPQRALSAARAGGTSLRHRRALWRSAPPSHISPDSRTCDVCDAKDPQKYKQTRKNTRRTNSYSKYSIHKYKIRGARRKERSLEGPWSLSSSRTRLHAQTRAG